MDALDSQESSDGAKMLSSSSEKKPPVYTYTKEELLALSNAAQCKRHLDGLDPMICRASVEDDTGEPAGQRLAPSWSGEGRSFFPRKDNEKRLPNNLPEWRKDSWRAGGGAPAGQHRRPYDDKVVGSVPVSMPTHQGQRLGWANGNQRMQYDRFNHGPGSHSGGNRWDQRGERNYRSHRDLEGDESGDVYANQIYGRSKPSWNSEHNDGGRSNNHSTGYGRPDSSFKSMVSSHQEAYKEDMGLYNDGETFGNDQVRDSEMVEQERKRRESFELMREEARRKNLERHKVNPEELLKRRHLEDSIWDTKLSTGNGDGDGDGDGADRDHGVDKLLLGPTTPPKTPTVPPGFSTPPPGFEKIARDVALDSGTSKSSPGGRWGDDIEEEQRVQGISSLEAVEGMALALEPAAGGEDESHGRGGQDPAKEWSFESMFGPSPFLSGTTAGSTKGQEEEGAAAASILNDLFGGADRRRHFKPSKDLETSNERSGDSKFAKWFSQGPVAEVVSLNDGGSKKLALHDVGHQMNMVGGGAPPVQAPVPAAAVSAAILSLLGKGQPHDDVDASGTCKGASILPVPPPTHAKPPPVHASAREARRPLPMPVAPSLEDIERAMAADAEAGSFASAEVSPLGMLQGALQDMLANSSSQGAAGMSRVGPANGAAPGAAAVDGSGLLGWFSNQPRGSPVNAYLHANNPKQRIVVGPSVKGGNANASAPTRPAVPPPSSAMRTLSEIEESLLADSRMETVEPIEEEEDGHSAGGDNVLGPLFGREVGAPAGRENDQASHFLLSLLQGKGEAGGGGHVAAVAGGGMTGGGGEGSIPQSLMGGRPAFYGQAAQGREMGGRALKDIKGGLKKRPPAAANSSAAQARVKVGPGVGPVGSKGQQDGGLLLQSIMTSIQADEGLPGGQVGGDARAEKAAAAGGDPKQAKTGGVADQGRGGSEFKENVAIEDDENQPVMRKDGDVNGKGGGSRILREKEVVLSDGSGGVTAGNAGMAPDGDASGGAEMQRKLRSSIPTPLVVGEEALSGVAADCPDSPGEIDGASLAASVAALALSGLSPISEGSSTPDPAEGAAQSQKVSLPTVTNGTATSATAAAAVSSQAMAGKDDGTGGAGKGDRLVMAAYLEEEATAAAAARSHGTARGLGSAPLDGYPRSNESGIYGQQHLMPGRGGGGGLAASLMLNPLARPQVHHGPGQGGLPPSETSSLLSQGALPSSELNSCSSSSSSIQSEAPASGARPPQGKEPHPLNLAFLGLSPLEHNSPAPLPGVLPVLEPPPPLQRQLLSAKPQPPQPPPGLFSHAGGGPFGRPPREEVAGGGGGGSGVANHRVQGGVVHMPPPPQTGPMSQSGPDHGAASTLKLPTAGLPNSPMPPGHQGQQQHMAFGGLPMMGPLPGGMPMPSYHTHHMVPPHPPPFGFMGLRGPYFPPMAYMQRTEPGARMPPLEAWMPGAQQGHQGGMFHPPPAMGLPPMHQGGGISGGLSPPAGQLEGFPFGVGHPGGNPAQYPQATAPGKGLNLTPPPGLADVPLQPPALDKWLEAFGNRPSRMPMPPLPGIQAMSLEELEQKLRVA